MKDRPNGSAADAGAAEKAPSPLGAGTARPAPAANPGPLTAGRLRSTLPPLNGSAAETPLAPKGSALAAGPPNLL